MNTNLQIFQINEFTKEPFKGNPAAVVPLDRWLPDTVMQNTSLENNLAETAFFVPNGDVYDLRWFTPTVEMDLCGHATLATGFLLFEILGTDQTILRFQTRSGELTVQKDGDKYVLDFPSRPGVVTEAPAGLIEAIGTVPKEIFKSRDYLFVYESEADVKAIRPDFSTLKNIDAHAVIVTAKGDMSDFVSRFFAPWVGVDEDPVTGSAHCTLIPFWADRLRKNELFARQVSTRGGELFCELRGDRVRIGGHAALYLKGEIYVEAEKASVPDVEIRRAVAGDEETIASLIYEAFAPFRGQYTQDAFEYTAANVETVRGRFAEGPMWLAYDGDEPVGTVSGMPDGDRFYIRSMAVKPSAQGKRVGQKLLDVFEEYARSAGFRKLYLYTTFVLPVARPMYEKNGFYIVRETPPGEWFGMGGIEMEKELN